MELPRPMRADNSVADFRLPRQLWKVVHSRNKATTPTLVQLRRLEKVADAAAPAAETDYGATSSPLSHRGQSPAATQSLPELLPAFPRIECPGYSRTQSPRSALRRLHSGSTPRSP